ncbi:hypothetical protein S40288_08139 [Stachybotrys chartarum IBT 40288]|nr:hypothetical protein S40288_08139 [Stachybotrys chartarum IBT 40288]
MEPNPSQDCRPTTPARVSFGVELEFLIGVGPKNQDPDAAISNQLAPFRDDSEDVVEALKTCLRDNGIPVTEVADMPSHNGDFDIEAERRFHGSQIQRWTVGQDLTVQDCAKGSYAWVGVEIASPASYAFDEAFDMVKLVVYLVTRNFRCRVNPTCGFHVHIGNGQRRMDLRALRNFCALWWAAEPLLSMLHPPERSVAMYSKSMRRTVSSELARGAEARDTLRGARVDPVWPGRYFGRARRLGEAPAASATRFLALKAMATPTDELAMGDPGWESDDSDWEAATGRPFDRPRKTGQPRAKVPPLEEAMGESLNSQWQLPDWLELERSSLRCGPPHIHRDKAPDTAGPQREDAQDDTTAAYREEAFQRRQPRVESHRPLEFFAQHPKVLERLDHVGVGHMFKHSRWEKDAWSVVEEMRPARSGTWSGVKEVLACDVSTLQLEHLLSGNKLSSLNMRSYEKMVMEEPAAASGWKLTVELRDGGGTLDGEWIATWARVVCRLVGWARDADPAELMRVIARCGADGGEAYDVIDLLMDTGCYAEVRHCEERLRRGEAAWYECLMLEQSAEKDEEDDNRW